MGEIIRIDDTKLERIPNDEVIDRLIDEFIEYRDYTGRSAELVRQTIKRFFKWQRMHNPETPIEYRTYLLDTGHKRSYIANQFSILRVFWEFLVVTKRATANPFRIVVVRQPDRPARVGLSEEQLKTLIETVEKMDIRTQAIINLMARTALRLQAVSALDVGDLDYSSNPPRLWVRHKGKHEKQDFVFVYPKVREKLERWLRHRPDTKTKAMFVQMRFPYERLTEHGVYTVVRKALKKAGIQGRTPHDLRHTAITLARKAGVPLDAVREMAGHKSMDTTLHYDHSVQRTIIAPEKILDEMF